MVDPQIVALIEAAWDAWLPWMGFLAGVAVSLVFFRFMVVFVVMSLGRDAGDRASEPSIFSLLAPPVQTPAQPRTEPRPGARDEVVEEVRFMARWLRAYVRGNPAAPWWRVSWRGLEKAFGRASYALFFAYFFLALVCAVLVSGGFPLEMAAALYFIAGLVWVQVIATVVISISIGEMTGMIIGFVCELGAMIGWQLIAGATQLTALGVAMRRGRLLSLTFALSEARKRGKPDWAARVITQAEAVTLYEADKVRLEERRAAREEQKARWRARRAARPRWKRVVGDVSLSLMVIVCAGIVLVPVVLMVYIEPAAGVGLAIVLAACGAGALFVWRVDKTLDRRAQAEYEAFKARLEAPAA